MSDWYVYIIACSDGTLYTGITTDYKRRLKEHNQGKAAKYTSSRTPVKLKYLETALNRSEASKRERAVKKMSRFEKIALCAKWKAVKIGNSPCPRLGKGGQT